MAFEERNYPYKPACNIFLIVLLPDENKSNSDYTTYLPSYLPTNHGNFVRALAVLLPAENKDDLLERLLALELKLFVCHDEFMTAVEQGDEHRKDIKRVRANWAPVRSRGSSERLYEKVREKYTVCL